EDAGTTMLVASALLGLLAGGYLFLQARKYPPRPQDRPAATPPQGAGPPDGIPAPPVRALGFAPGAGRLPHRFLLRDLRDPPGRRAPRPRGHRHDPPESRRGSSGSGARGADGLFHLDVAAVLGAQDELGGGWGLGLACGRAARRELLAQPVCEVARD